MSTNQETATHRSPELLPGEQLIEEPIRRGPQRVAAVRYDQNIIIRVSGLNACILYIRVTVCSAKILRYRSKVCNNFIHPSNSLQHVHFLKRYDQNIIIRVSGLNACILYIRVTVCSAKILRYRSKVCNNFIHPSNSLQHVHFLKRYDQNIIIRVSGLNACILYIRVTVCSAKILRYRSKVCNNFIHPSNSLQHVHFLKRYRSKVCNNFIHPSNSLQHVHFLKRYDQNIIIRVSGLNACILYIRVTVCSAKILRYV
ncbi:uncharacterized protein [Anabrus simplex]|uniref:uncharacterized protein n=1 Tax=Anabrus simplex TaxID=316456 RepID=UPI0035A2ACD0